MLNCYNSFYSFQFKKILVTEKNCFAALVDLEAASVNNLNSLKVWKWVAFRMYVSLSQVLILFMYQRVKNVVHECSAYLLMTVPSTPGYTLIQEL